MRAAALLRWLITPAGEWGRVALVAPVLLFPQVRPIVTVAVVAIWLVLTVAARDGKWRLVPAAVAWPALGLAGMVAVATLVTPSPELAIPKAAGVLLGLLVLRLIVVQVRGPGMFRRAVGGYLLLGLVWLATGALSTAWLGKFSALQTLTALLPRLIRTLPGAPAEGVHPNAIGGATLFFVPLLLGVLLWNPPGRLSGRPRDSGSPACGAGAPLSKGELWGILALLGFFGGLLALSQSRTAWLSSAAVVASLALIRFRLARRIAAVAGAAGVAGAAVFWTVLAPWVRQLTTSFGTNIHPTDITLAVRVDLWSRAAAAIRDFPWTGLGLNAFRRVVHVFYPPLRMSPELDIAHCHNVFLQTALDVGLPGLTAYLLVVAVAITFACRTGVRSSGLTAGVAWGLAGNLVAVHLFGLADAIALGAKVGLFLWANIGLIVAIDAMACRRRDETAARHPSNLRRLPARARVAVAIACALLGVGLAPKVVATACGNASALRVFRFYYRGGPGAWPPCSAALVGADRGATWLLGLDDSIRGNRDRARPLLLAGLAGTSEPDRRQLIDQLLTLASRRGHDDLSLVDFALRFAGEAGHDSALGYLAVARFYRDRYDRGLPDALDPARTAYSLAARTTAPQFRNRVARAEAWFNLGQLWYAVDRQKALAADLAAVDGDPTDESWGYGWMSAMQAVEIYAERGDWQSARSLLRRAAGMPDLYHRHSYTALRLAQLEAGLGDKALAISILERAVTADVAFTATRLFLASLYREQGRIDEARAQYRAVLRLDGAQPDAQRALTELR